MPRGRWVLFETGPFTQETDAARDIKTVPVDVGMEDKKLATRWGRLMHELLVAPVPVMRAVRQLLTDASYICADEYAPLFTSLWPHRMASSPDGATRQVQVELRAASHVALAHGRPHRRLRPA